MYHVSAQGIDERMINVHYYYKTVSRMGPRNKTGHPADNQKRFKQAVESSLRPFPTSRKNPNLKS